MKTLVRLGTLGYRGFDYHEEGGKALHADPGQSVTCSDRRALRLLQDFPNGWQDVTPVPEFSEPVATERREVEREGEAPTGADIPPQPRRTRKARE